MGRYAAGAGSSSCSLCPRGRYAATPGQDSCELCPPGRFSFKEGTSAFSDCTLDTHSISQILSAPRDVPTRAWQPTPGKVAERVDSADLTATTTAVRQSWSDVVVGVEWEGMRLENNTLWGLSRGEVWVVLRTGFHRGAFLTAFRLNIHLFNGTTSTCEKCTITEQWEGRDEGDGESWWRFVPISHGIVAVPSWETSDGGGLADVGAAVMPSNGRNVTSNAVLLRVAMPRFANGTIFAASWIQNKRFVGYVDQRFPFTELPPAPGSVRGTLERRSVVEALGSVGRDGWAQARVNTSFVPDRTVQIASGGRPLYDKRACAVFWWGGLRCWGFSKERNFGLGFEVDYIGRSTKPVDMPMPQVGEPVVEVSIGLYHVCVLVLSGKVRCFGKGENGELGYGNTNTIGDDEHVFEAGTVPLQGEDPLVLQVTCGAFHTCVLLSGGNVTCWGLGGANGKGVANIGDDETAAAAGILPLHEEVLLVSAGDSHTCVLVRRGVVRCWGFGNKGELGDGDMSNVSFASDSKDVILSEEVVEISLGGEYSLVLTASGATYCWGFDFKGYASICYDHTSPRGSHEWKSPTEGGALYFGLPRDVVGIFAGEYCAIFLLSTGDIVVRGSNLNSQFGGATALELDLTGVELPQSAVVDVGGVVISAAASSISNCVLLSTGSVRCFGTNKEGMLGTGSGEVIGDGEAPSDEFSEARWPHMPLLRTEAGTVSTIPLQRPLGMHSLDAPRKRVQTSGIVDICTGGEHACALSAGGSVKCWGSDDEGQLGRWRSVNGEVSLSTVVAAGISCGEKHTCILRVDSTVDCFGSAEFGQLGRGSAVDSNIPFVAFSKEPVRQMCSGSWHNCVVTAFGNVYCWGGGSFGKLGTGSNEDVGDDEKADDIAEPVRLGASAVAVACGRTTTCVLLEEGVVRCFGEGKYLGLGREEDVGDDEFPDEVEPVATGGRVASIHMGPANHMCFILAADGTLRCTGDGSDFAVGAVTLGLFGDEPSEVPAGNPGLNDVVVDVGIGWLGHTCAVFETGVLKCWGYSKSGQVGSGRGATIRHFPKIRTDAQVELVEGGDSFTCALLEGGVVKCWGRGDSGQLGDWTDEKHGYKKQPFAIPATNIGFDNFPQPSSQATNTLTLSNSPSGIPLLSDANYSALLLAISPSQLLDWKIARLSLPGFLSPLPPLPYSTTALLVETSSISDVVAHCPFVALQIIGANVGCAYEAAPWSPLTAGVVTGAIDTFDAMVVSTPLAAGGGSELRISADMSILAAAGGVERVEVGGRMCGNPVIRDSMKLLSCIAPAGVGKHVDVVVSWRNNNFSSIANLSILSTSYRPPQLQSISPPFGIPVLGNESTLLLSGSEFGPASLEAPLQVLVDGMECGEVKRLSDQLVQCSRVPMGVGVKRSVVVVSGGQKSNERFISTATPILHRVTPSYALLGSITNVTFTGEHLALEARDVVLAAAGGVPLSHCRIHEQGVELCCLLDVRNATSWPHANVVEINIGGMSSGLVRGLFDGVEPPSVSAVTPITPMSTVGGGVMRVIGEGFGHSVLDIRAVVFSTTSSSISSSSVTFVSSFELLAVSPPGVGTVEVSVLSSMGLISNQVSVSYAAPSITSVTPGHLVLGEVARVMINGTNFGLTEDDIGSVGVGGMECKGVVVVTPGVAFSCSVDSSMAEEWPNPRAVHVNVSGQSTGDVVGYFIGHPAPEIVAVAPATRMESSGGGVVLISAQGLGSEPRDVTGVMFGSKLYNDYEWSSLQLRVRAPPGVGAIGVQVVTKGGRRSSHLNITYDPPEVLSATPSYLLAGVMHEHGVVLHGNSLALQSSDVTFASIGGIECGVVEVISSASSLRCGMLDARNGWPSPREVEVVVAGLGSGKVRGVFEGIDEPTLLAATALGEAKTIGGTGVRLAASGLGPESSAVRGIWVVDGTNSTTFIPIHSIQYSTNQLQLPLPPGVGSCGFVVESAVGRLSNSLSVPYAPPRLFSTSPSILLIGTLATSIHISGINMPPTIDSLPLRLLNATVGGVGCGSVEVVTGHKKVLCKNLDTRGMRQWPLEDAVEVCVGGQCTGIVSGLIETLSAPQVFRTTPTVVTRGSALTIVGINFGKELEDVGGVFVGATRCGSVILDTESVLQCTIPLAHPEMEDPNGPTFLSISVCNKHQVCDNSSVQVQVSGRGSPPVPIAPPILDDAWRAVGLWESVQVRMSYLSATEEANLLALLGVGYSTVADFEVQAATNASFPSASIISDAWSFDGSEEGGEVRRLRGALDLKRRGPYFVRARARTAEGGWSKWSEVLGPVHEACDDDEYLATHLSTLALQVCTPCLENMTVCAGLEAENITARSGLWRVPWAPSIPSGFEPCTLPEACLGWSDEPPRADPEDPRPRALRRQAIVNMSLVPEAIESCAPGYTGILCQQCAANFYRDFGQRCSPCGDPAVATLRFLGIVLFLMVGLGVLFWRAVRSGLKADATKAIELAVAKAILNHFQGLLIITAALIEWPIPVLGFFSTASSGAEITLDGMSMECLLPATKDPFLSTTLSLYAIPAIVFLYGVVFWLLAPTCSRSLSYLSSRIRRLFGLQLSKQELILRNVELERKGRLSPHSAIRPDDPTDHGLPLASWSSYPPSLLCNTEALLDRFAVTGLVTAFILHTTVTVRAFRILTCRNLFAPAPRFLLASNLDFDCTDPQVRSKSLSIAIPALLLFSLGVPLFTTIAILTCIYGKRAPHLRRIWTFTFSGLQERPHTMIWESVIMLRKVLIGASNVFLSVTDPLSQLTSALLILFIALAAHSWVKPFKRADHNAVEYASLVASCFTIISGIYVAVRGKHALGGLGITIAVIVSNVAFLLFAIAVGGQRLWPKLYHGFMSLPCIPRPRIRSLVQLPSSRSLIARAATSTTESPVSTAILTSNPMRPRKLSKRQSSGHFLNPDISFSRSSRTLSAIADAT